LTALVGGDEAVRRAHTQSVSVALDIVEHYVQARRGGLFRPETTGAWVAGCFEHDSARPVNGYAAPHLHTHVVVFNMTQRADGNDWTDRPAPVVQEHTTLRDRDLSRRVCPPLEDLGYRVTVDKRGVPLISGFSQEYLEAASPRRKQILDALAARAASRRSGSTGGVGPDARTQNTALA
jgi:conjugative relaxase-like TrwC/TraI family protein